MSVRLYIVIPRIEGVAFKHVQNKILFAITYKSGVIIKGLVQVSALSLYGCYAIHYTPLNVL